ncbi:MAG: hypothetical protein A3A33_00770 [Candidatus Yanofskybacteria bacterium RIFCSPLOWO2_01_FULL_49_25]|uniref:Uncharacterized protein n=1 Tax=Candidatus Yanofskybacteria bacterium RIFCSPLOWO2_01_FULL_49_25 TaxID=1802701 RepID=A0A1F8GXU2_9BACT|nr:MAG: hypothetical protein A3A33_00770 [Candidatus Yanofskybacteria bacterium RIFCSPLOWO2_01_FULL_49_25]
MSFLSAPPYQNRAERKKLHYLVLVHAHVLPGQTHSAFAILAATCVAAASAPLGSKHHQAEHNDVFKIVVDIQTQQRTMAPGGVQKRERRQSTQGH